MNATPLLTAVFFFSAAAGAQAGAQPPADPYADTVKSAPADTDRLYQEFGGEEGVARVVDAFIRIALEDPRIAHTFEESNMDRFREKLSLQLCWLMGGPCVYDGLGMRESHAPLDITAAQFGAMVEDFQDAMDEAGVSFRTQNKLLKLLAPMRRDIVLK